MKLAFLTISLFFLLSCNNNPGWVNPVRKDIVHAVYAYGNIYPESRFVFNSVVSAEVRKITVNPGDFVRKGQVVFVLGNDISDLNESTALNNLNLAEKNAGINSAQLNMIYREVEVAKSKYILDSINAGRYERLLSQNAVSKNMAEQFQLAFQTSRQNYLKAISGWQASKDRFETELLNARNQYRAQTEQKGEFNLVAPFDGYIFNINVEEGDLASPQKMLGEIGLSSGFEADLEVDETDAAFLKENQKVYFELDARKGEYIEGKVKKIYPYVDPLNKVVRVIASVDSLPVSLLSGMSVEANILIEKRTKALLIPRSYVLSDDSLIVKDDDQERRIKLIKGLQDISYVEVLNSDINEKTQVIMPR
jgi:HlyD family secretion protein